MKNGIFYIILFFGFIYLYINNNHYEKFSNIRFLHIPKNAGTSFRESYPNIYSTNHFNAFPLKNKINIIIIRNPYSRLQSIFAHIQKRTNDKTCNDLVHFKTLDSLAKAYYNTNSKFHKDATKLLYWTKNKLNLYKIFNKNGGCPRRIDIPCIHWAPQYFYLENKKNIDYILRFEKLDSDINLLRKNKDLKKFFIRDINHKKKSSDFFKKNTEITPLVSKLVKDIYGLDIVLYKKYK